MIIFQQGAHKTASSFCSQLLRGICEQNGHDQEEAHVKLGLEPGNSYVELLAGKTKELKDATPYTALKTHNLPGPAAGMLNANKAIAFITFRDPLDAIQSLMDHSAKKVGEEATEMNDLTVPKALELHLRHLSYSVTWMRLPNVWPIYYSQLVNNTPLVVKGMAAKLKLPVDVDALLDEIGAPRRLNVGKGGRGLALLEGKHSVILRNRLAFLYQAGWWTNSSLQGAEIMKRPPKGGAQD